MTTPQDTRIWYNDARHVVGTLGPLMVQIWRGEHTLEKWANDVVPVLQYMKAHHPQGQLNISIMEPTAEMPTQMAREELAATVKAQGGFTVASALIMTGSGMHQTMVRAAVAATRMLVGSITGERLRTFTSVEEGLKYLEEAGRKAGVVIDVAAAASFVQGLRERKSAAG